MPKVICTLPNASRLINGVVFTEHELGMVSEDMTPEQAESFLNITGYVEHTTATATSSATSATPKTTLTLKKNLPNK